MKRLIFALLLPVTLSAQLKRFEFTQNKMGSPFNLIFYHPDSVEAVALSKECFLIVDSLNNIFSDYMPDSEIGQLSQLKPLQRQKISDELLTVLLLSKQAWKRSNKTFDITIGSLTHLWRQAKKENRFPAEAEIRTAKTLTGFKNVLIDQQQKTIAFKKSRIQLDFGGIVKGYAAQKVVDYLKTKGITVALADAGGDIVMSDPPPNKPGWVVGINIPESEIELWHQKLELKHFAVATSGDVYRFTIHNGRKYSHIIDPRTGYGVTSQRNVTVISKEGEHADWLATACSILPVKKALKLAEKEHAALFIAIMDDEKVTTYKTKNFDRFFQEKQR